jgi:hypothetical protein
MIMELILQAAADAEIAAIMHWRSSYLVRLMHTIGNSPQPKVRRAAIRMHAMEIEAILQDLSKGHFHTAAGAKIDV